MSKRTTSVPNKTQKSTKKQKKAVELEETKAAKCNKVVIPSPRELNDEMVQKTESCSIKWDHKSPSSSSASPEDNSCDFFMDLLSMDMEFNQENENREHDINDFFAPPIEEYLLNNTSSDESMFLEDWEAMNAVASFLSSEDEQIL